jgi:hypothetical protein
MASIQKIKCLLGHHDWFTENDRHQMPVFRICQCCGKYQQPILSKIHFAWAEIDPNTITASVLRQRAKLENQLLQTL